jgi:hypothetical protein
VFSKPELPVESQADGAVEVGDNVVAVDAGGAPSRVAVAVSGEGVPDEPGVPVEGAGVRVRLGAAVAVRVRVGPTVGVRVRVRVGVKVG